MKDKYSSEIEGMQDFWSALGVVPDYSCNTDGRVKGTLFEFKLDDNNHDVVYKNQCIRYLKAYNSSAKDIPARTVVVTLNSREYTVYNNASRKSVKRREKYSDAKELEKFIVDEYVKGFIDEYSIVAYNDRFYSEMIGQDKELFLEELRSPKVLNIQPFDLRAEANEKLCASILDCLGGTALKKRLGAFFTPDRYVQVATEYVRNAIRQVPKGNDYVIIDRAAGSGNLFKFFTNEELSHCILNTYVYSEWTTLKGLYADRVRYIVPHTSKTRQSDGTLEEGDALSEKFVNDVMIRKYVDDPKCTVILLENPPYSEPGSKYQQVDGSANRTKGSFVNVEMKKDLKVKGRASTDLSNQFIWSGFEYYLKKTGDRYIVFAPIKYWKTQGLCDKVFVEGYLCNKKFFHASESSISLIHWQNIDKSTDAILLQSDLGDKLVKKIHNGINSLVGDRPKSGFAECCFYNGTPSYLHGVLGNTPIKMNACRVRLNRENVLKVLPLWVANAYKCGDYTEIDVVMKAADSGDKYLADIRFVHDCLVWACLTNQNHCVSDKDVRNELCFNQKTEADRLLDTTTTRYDKLLTLWNDVLSQAKLTDEYVRKFTYGLHQICQQLNVKVDSGSRTKTGQPVKVYKYPELKNAIDRLKECLKTFYHEEIVPKLFDYELLK